LRMISSVLEIETLNNSTRPLRMFSHNRGHQHKFHAAHSCLAWAAPEQPLKERG
jgi:hypothetical protein